MDETIEFCDWPIGLGYLPGREDVEGAKRWTTAPFTSAQADAISRALDKSGFEFGPIVVRLRQDGV